MLEMWIAIGSIVICCILGISLAHFNLKLLAATKQERLEARRAYKKEYNKRLAKFYGITLREDIPHKSTDADSNDPDATCSRDQ